MKLAALALALMVSPALAEPRDKLAACKAGSTIAFEVDKRHDDRSVLDTKIYDTGAWAQKQVTKDASDERRGCLTGDQRAQVDKLIKSAPWTIETARITCKAVSADSTVYTIAGKTFTQRLCGAQHLDDKSAAALKDLEAIAAALK